MLSKNYYEKAKDEVEINITAPVNLPPPLSRLESLDTVVIVSSGLAFVPLTEAPVYSATKAFIHSFTFTARHSLKEKKVGRPD